MKIFWPSNDRFHTIIEGELLGKTKRGSLTVYRINFQSHTRETTNKFWFDTYEAAKAHRQYKLKNSLKKYENIVRKLRNEVRKANE